MYDNIALFDAAADRLLVLTSRGAHCTFYDGLLWPRPGLGWADRLALDYLAAVLQLRAEERATAQAAQQQRAPAEAPAAAEALAA